MDNDQKLFNDPITIPVEDADGNLHVFEGCHINGIEYRYPAGGSVIAEEVGIEFLPLHKVISIE